MSKQKTREQYLLDVISEYEKFTGIIGCHLKDRLWDTCIVDWLLLNRAIDRIERNKDQYTQDQSGWISFADGKPKQGERVLLKTNYNDNCPYVVGYWGCGEWEACTVNVIAEKDYNGNEALVDRAFESSDVIQWQYLPPTEEA